MNGRTKRSPNSFTHCEDGTSVLLLRRKDGSVLSCRIDTTDFERVSQHTWYAHTSSRRRVIYAQSATAGLLHRFILGLVDPSLEVDHKNHNGLDNRRSNLRPATAAQNHRNAIRPCSSCSSKYRGVRWHRADRRWAAQISVNGKDIHLGEFLREEDAARAYNEAARKHHGEFALLNEVGQ